MPDRMPTLFLGHGSPMTVITDSPERRMWQALGAALPRPQAILAVTAHWETRGATRLTSAERPRTIHDFGGFPQELYEIQYSAPGSPELVARVEELLSGERVERDPDYGFDHGAWGVVLPMFPAGDIPLVAMSLNRDLPPERHLALGAALAPLRDEGVLIVASGNIVHNLSLWRQSIGMVPAWAEAFRARTNAAIAAGDTATLTRLDPDDRATALAVNSGEHYLPLLYAIGARRPGEDATIFSDSVEGALSMTSVLVGEWPQGLALAA